MEMYVSFSDFLRFYRKKRVAFLVVVLLFGVVCGLAPLKLAQYSYSANTTILLTSDIPESSDINSNLQLPSILNNRIQTAIAEASSNDLLEKTASQLGIDKTEIGKITGEQVKNSLAVKVTVQTSNAAMAAKISDTAAQLLGEQITQQFPSPKLAVYVTEKAMDSKAQGRKSAMVKAGLLGLILGFIAFVCYGLIRVLCDHTVRAGASAEETLQTRFLGNTPRSEENSASADAFRRLRAVLLHTEGDAVSFLVSGVENSVCGSDTAAGLAKALAQTGRKTLLIEANLRSPALAEKLGAKSDKSIIDVLSGSCEAEQAAASVSAQPGLYFLAGAVSAENTPADMLAQSFAGILEDAEKHFERVVVCAPAETQYPDAESIAPSVSAVILAPKYGETTYNALREAIRSIKETGGKLAGFVIADC